jgi:NTP pyrophosphatase (non-canonical NTP hydrolase)
MDIKELTAAMHQFVDSQHWYDAESPKPQTLKNLAISLAIEASEVLEHFQWNDEMIDRQALADELADVSLYLLQISSLAHIDLEQAIMDKLKKNYTRNWGNKK